MGDKRGKEIRRARRRAGMSLNDLARETKIAKGLLSNYENGNVDVSEDRMELIASATDAEYAPIIDAPPKVSLIRRILGLGPKRLKVLTRAERFARTGAESHLETMGETLTRLSND